MVVVDGGGGGDGGGSGYDDDEDDEEDDGGNRPEPDAPSAGARGAVRELAYLAGFLKSDASFVRGEERAVLVIISR